MDSPFPPGCLFCGCITAFPNTLGTIRERLEELYGPICKQSEIFHFPSTTYYTPTMGEDLKRVFYVFEEMVPQDCLAKVKRATCALEEQIARESPWPVPRPLNLDPGLVAENRLVLASTKPSAHRLPREDGIYEEITLLFAKGSFQPLSWTYPDWRSPEYRDFFLEVRKEFLARSKQERMLSRGRALKKRFS